MRSRWPGEAAVVAPDEIGPAAVSVPGTGLLRGLAAIDRFQQLSCPQETFGTVQEALPANALVAVGLVAANSSQTMRVAAHLNHCHRIRNSFGCRYHRGLHRWSDSNHRARASGHCRRPGGHVRTVTTATPAALGGKSSSTSPALRAR